MNFSIKTSGMLVHKKSILFYSTMEVKNHSQPVHVPVTSLHLPTKTQQQLLLLRHNRRRQQRHNRRRQLRHNPRRHNRRRRRRLRHNRRQRLRRNQRQLRLCHNNHRHITLYLLRKIIHGEVERIGICRDPAHLTYRVSMELEIYILICT